MLTGSTALVAVRRRDRPSLSKVSEAPAVAPNSAPLILQTLFAELASVKQQLNAMVVARPGSLQSADPPGQATGAERPQSVEPSRLRKIFD